MPGRIRVWRYASGCYTPWREFLDLPILFNPSPVYFSPTSSSILARFLNTIQVYPLDGPPIVAPPDGAKPLAILSPCGTYIATARQLGHTVTITSPLSQTVLQLIDTDMDIWGIALTGNILLVFDSGRVRVAAWLLTEGGLVDGVFGDRRADDGDGIWVAWAGAHITNFTIKGKTVVIEEPKHTHAYHTGTGEAIGPTRVHPCDPLYSLAAMSGGQHYPHYHAANIRDLPRRDLPVPLVAPRVEWVKDPEGKHRLWMPVEWRARPAGWLSNIKALWLCHTDGPVIIMF